jgi:hypothetical protein
MRILSVRLSLSTGSVRAFDNERKDKDLTPNNEQHNSVSPFHRLLPLILLDSCILMAI